MASRLSDAQRARWAGAGIGLLEPSEAFPRLERALVGQAAHVAVMAIDPERFLHEAGPAARALMADVTLKIAPAGEPETKPLAAMYAAATSEARSEIVLAYVRRQLAHVLGISEAAFNIDMPLSDLGLDSLMAVQLRNRIEADLPLKFSLEKLLGDSLRSSLRKPWMVNSGIPADRWILIARKSCYERGYPGAARMRLAKLTRWVNR